MTYTISFNNTLNQIFNVCSLVTNNTVAEASTTFSSFILLSLLLVALVLTFHTKGTTVHKVLGLLLASIFVVFLWMLQSQFLFIYVVYILAFISAVLMLFLSVVLMLPISTLTTKNTLTDRKNSHKMHFFAITMTQNYITISALSAMTIMVLVLVLFYIKSARTFKTAKLYNDLMEYSKYRFKISNQISINNYFNNATTHVKFNMPQSEFTPNLISSLYNNAMQIGYTSWKIALNLKQENTSISNFKYVTILCLIFNLTIFELVSLHLKAEVFKTISAFKYSSRLMFQVFKVINNLPSSAMKVLWDIVVQTYLFIMMLLSMVFLFLSNQNFLQITTSALNNNLSQGLGQIKGLLYGDFSLLLLLSTLVLLIALLGAAVMTRSKR